MAKKHFKGNINLVLIHSGIVNGRQLLCNAHSVIEPHRGTAALFLFFFFFIKKKQKLLTCFFESLHIWKLRCFPRLICLHIIAYSGRSRTYFDTR